MTMQLTRASMPEASFLSSCYSSDSGRGLWCDLGPYVAQLCHEGHSGRTVLAMPCAACRKTPSKRQVANRQCHDVQGALTKCTGDHRIILYNGCKECSRIVVLHMFILLR
jgi:hypothetical protein